MQFEESPAAKAANANALNTRDPDFILSPIKLSF